MKMFAVAGYHTVICDAFITKGNSSYDYLSAFLNGMAPQKWVLLFEERNLLLEEQILFLKS